MVNNNFGDDYLSSISVDQGTVDRALSCLDTFCRDSSAIVSTHKTNFWLLELDSVLTFVIHTWFMVYI